MVICLEQGADLHMAQRISLPLTVSCFSKIQVGFTFLVPAHPGSPGQRAVKRVCVCVCSIVKHLSCDALLHYKYVIQFTGERIYKIVEHLAKLQAKWFIVSYATFALNVCPQRCRTRQISKITCMTDRNCC